MEWIKCSERMPVIEPDKWRTGMPLIVKCDIGVVPAYFVWVYRADGNQQGFKQSLRFGNNEGSMPKEDHEGLMKNVTDWMPMPAYPLE